MKFGVSMLGLDLKEVLGAAKAADDLGFESVWLSDHLIVPVDADGEMPEHGNVPPELPLYDIGSTMAYLGAMTTRIRIGSWVYVLPLRHPFTSARAFQTADILTDGRIEIGVGAGYIKAEFDAAGIDFGSRGRMTDEALQACKLLWSEERPQFHGEFYSFDPVGFEPKPLQRPWPAIHIGGESVVAFRRAARFGDGWIGTEHSPASLAPQLRRLRSIEDEVGRTKPLTVTVAGGPVTGRKGIPQVDAKAIDAFSALGVDRLIVRPWRYGRGNPQEALEQFASQHLR